MDPEQCAVANFSQTVNKAWGYADANCGHRFVFMCRNISEWLLLLLLLLLLQGACLTVKC
jgi:hypothetical protein